MLNALRKFFSGDDVTDAVKERQDIDPVVAAAALLVETALIDGVYADIEEAQILRIVTTSFGLDDDKAREILSEAEALQEASTGAHEFTSRVKTLGEEARVAVIQALFEVSLVDGEKCPYEDAFVRHVASLLHVTDVDRAHARQRAEAKVAAGLS